MDKKELKIYQDAIKQKYKYHTLWKVLAIIFICLTILFASLYFGSGDLFKETINNDIEIINENSGNNSNNVTITN